MGEINVKTTEIDSAVSKLQLLKTRCVSADINAPATIGGGRVVNELETIAAVYKSMNAQIGVLIQNTISFLENVKNSYVSSDKTAAKKITGK